MVTKQQGELIGLELIEQAEKNRVEMRNAHARRVSWFYQFPEMASLEPWQRAKVIEDASFNLTTKKAFIFPSILWIIFWPMVWFGFLNSAVTSTSIWIISTIVFVPELAYRIFYMRKLIKEQIMIEQAKRKT